MNERLDELEIKLSFQQEVLDSLNETITKQWQEIDFLKKHLNIAHQRLTDLAENLPNSDKSDPPPPHY